MFSKIDKTHFPPSDKPIMVWDGECDFCNYWIQRWKIRTKDKIVYKTYQEVASQFKDIPLKEFKKASRLIETNGKVYSGPDSAYRSYYHTSSKNKTFNWHFWYVNYDWFMKLSDHIYNHVAKHRSLFFRITKIFFGKNPEHMKPYWLLYIFLLISMFFLILKLL